MKWLLWIVGVIVALAIVGLGALPWLVDTPRVQTLIASSATQALGRPVRFQSVSVWALPRPVVRLRGLEVAEDAAFGREPFLKLDTGELTIRLRPLLTGHLEFGDLILRKPLIALVQNADGRWNVASLGGVRDEARAPARAPRSGGAGGGLTLPVTRVKIADGVVTYATRGPGSAPTRYRIEDLDLTLTGGTSQLGFSGTARLVPGNLGVKISDGTLGLTPRGMQDAPIAGRVVLEARDIAETVRPLAPAGTALGGGLRGTLTLGGTVGALRASGPVELSRLAVTQTQADCPDPKQRTLTFPSVTLATTYEPNRLSGRPMTATLGKGTITAQLSVTLERRVRVELRDLAIRAIPLETVLVDYLCEGYAVSGPLDLTGALAFTTADVLNTLNGPGTLRIGPGKVVGRQALALLDGVVRLSGGITAVLKGEAPSDLFSAPLDFDSITGTYTVADGVATTRDLTYTSRRLKALVTGDYGLATGRMNLDVALTTVSGQIKAKITGTSASPSLRIVSESLVPTGKSVEQSIKDLLKRLR
ncbi:MAG: AsmA family protein [Candidatus Rokuibacteriota bacterium]